jgi:hypothetical protein
VSAADAVHGLQVLFEEVTGAYGVGQVIGQWKRPWRPVEYGMGHCHCVSTVSNATSDYNTKALYENCERRGSGNKKRMVSPGTENNVIYDGKLPLVSDKASSWRGQPRGKFNFGMEKERSR